MDTHIPRHLQVVLASAVVQCADLNSGFRHSLTNTLFLWLAVPQPKSAKDLLAQRASPLSDGWIFSKIGRFRNTATCDPRRDHFILVKDVDGNVFLSIFGEYPSRAIHIILSIQNIYLV